MFVRRKIYQALMLKYRNLLREHVALQEKSLEQLAAYTEFRDKFENYQKQNCSHVWHTFLGERVKTCIFCKVSEPLPPSPPPADIIPFNRNRHK